MNYSMFTPEMKEIIKQQQDPQGNVARSSFIASLSKLILEQYVESKNEERELLLQTSTRVQNEENELKPIRERRIELAKNMDYIYDVLKSGSEKARSVANETLRNVRNAIGVEYFKN